MNTVGPGTRNARPAPPQAPQPPATSAPAAAAPSKKPVWGPPPTIDDNELVHLLMTQPRPNMIVPYPRKLPGLKDPISHVVIVAAMPDDKIQAYAAAHHFSKRILADPVAAKEKGETKFSPEELQSQGYVTILKNRATIELLLRMCKKAKRRKGATQSTAADYEIAYNAEGHMQDAFPGAAWMQAHMPDDEIAVLVAAYHRVQLEIGPIVSELSEADCDLWIEKLIAGGERGDPLDSLGLDARADLVKRLVFHLAQSRKDNSSSGALLESGSDGSGTSTETPEEVVEPPAVEDVEAPHVDDLAVDPHAT